MEEYSTKTAFNKLGSLLWCQMRRLEMTRTGRPQELAVDISPLETGTYCIAHPNLIDRNHGDSTIDGKNPLCKSWDKLPRNGSMIETCMSYSSCWYRFWMLLIQPLKRKFSYFFIWHLYDIRSTKNHHQNLFSESPKLGSPPVCRPWNWLSAPAQNRRLHGHFMQFLGARKGWWWDVFFSGGTANQRKQGCVATKEMRQWVLPTNSSLKPRSILGP